MGNFYVNYTLRGVSQQAVAAAMANRSAFVSPSDKDAVVVFDHASDSQEEAIISELGKDLSSKLKCPLLAVLNHDDDILWYQLLSLGELIGEYNSCPDYFDFGGGSEAAGPSGGDAEILCKTFGSGKVDRVREILSKSVMDEDGYAFAFQRHADLFEALGLPSFSVGASYASIKAGELPEGLSEDDLIRT